MGSVDQVRQWVSGNDFFAGARVLQGKDIFIPRQTTYPHVHIGSDFITYSKTSTNHMYLVDRGDVVNKGRILNAFQDSGEAHIMQLCRYMTSQL